MKQVYQSKRNEVERIRIDTTLNTTKLYRQTQHNLASSKGLVCQLAMHSWMVSMLQSLLTDRLDLGRRTVCMVTWMTLRAVD